ncbi:glycosyltransferase family 39 protein [Streptomyces sp. KLOTTS4A1]|uniref:glycosyltransferase family 39 protein n=1 Tax=Streptomyces sp. KLOTTS4A1 TaxID=3390996 RepID=UPI0039F5C8FC
MTALTPSVPTAPTARRRTAAASVLHRLWTGRPDDPRWARPAFLALLLLTGAAYLWNLSASGYANSFYSAAVQAGSESWKAFFFGSSDAANAITVDKPPAALWPMALSVRAFGLGSWQILLPQVLMGVGTAAVLYAAVRRRFSAAAGLIAAAVLALTPVAALMFRFNNPDALLAFLMTVAVYCVLRALEHGRTKWLLWAGAAVGFAFLVKTLQAFLILPPLAVLYAVCAPVPLRKRLGQLALSALTLVVCGGWWVAIVELWPASSRPYIGGSQHNSFLELTFGYNGLGRLNGEETGSVGGGGGGGRGGGWGETGIDRLFAGNIGGQIAWLLPAALVLLVAGLWLTRRAPRTDPARAALLAWGGSLLATAAVFSWMQGIFHEYYTVALAPYIAALIGMGAAMLWEERGRLGAAATLAVTVAGTAWWSYELLGRSTGYAPWLRWAVLVAGALGAVCVLLAARLGRQVALAAVGLGLFAGLAGPTAYTLTTLGEGHGGSIVTAGPSVTGGRGGPGGGGPGGGARGDGGPGGGGMAPPTQGQTGGQGQGQGMPGDGQLPGDGGAPGGAQAPGSGTQNGGSPDGTERARDGADGRGGGMGRGGGGMGGLLNGANVDDETRSALLENAADYTWVAAAVGSQNQAAYQLATERPVLSVGGFNGSDPSPSLARFKQYVAEGRIHYFVGGGGMGAGPGVGSNSASTQVTEWVEATFEQVTVGGTTLYDLTAAKAG